MNSSDLPPAHSALASAVDAVMAQHVGLTFPSCALAVWHRGTPVLHRAWGACEGHAATTETWFDIASITKLFTTTVFLRCVSQGQVGLDDPLCAVVPEFARSGLRPIEGGQDPHTLQRQALDPALAGQWVDPERVTFRHVLTHTSGLPAWRDVFNQTGAVPAAPLQLQPADASARWAWACEALQHYPFIDQPGQRVVYSDIGFMWLGRAVEVLCGLPLDQAIQAHVLGPLGLAHTGFDPVRRGRVPLTQTAPTEMDLRWRQRRVWGEVHDENAWALGGVAGHAGLFATAMDVARLGQTWLASPSLLGLTSAVAATAITEQAVSEDQRRGWGFVIKSWQNASAGDRFSSHTFGHTGFTGTTLWVDPDRECVVSCLTNGVYAGRSAHAPHAFRRQLHDAVAVSL